MRRLVAVVAILCFGGCATTATIARTDGPDSEARIERSDAGAIYVSARNGRIYRIPREAISDIDHPGNVEILVGSILLGMTGLIVASIYDNTSPNNRDAMLPVALVYGGPGLSLLISGLVKYVPSIRAAQAFESVEAAPAWVPPQVMAPPLPPASPPGQPVPAPSAPSEEPGPEVVPNPTSPP